MYRALLIFILCLPVASQESSPWDTLDVKYRLIQSEYGSVEDIIKIKIPPYLNTFDVMKQVKLVVQFPGSPPPQKKTTVYVFRDDDKIGTMSKTGAVYLPGKGYKWDLRDWRQDDSIFDFEPRAIDKLIYNTLLDTMFTKGFYSNEFEETENDTKRSVARRFEISVSDLDSIYYRVKWWNELAGKK